MPHARIRALEQRTSVNPLVREHLEEYARRDATEDPAAQFLALTEETRSGSGESGRSWTRSLLAEASTHDFLISTQVLQEFYVTVTRKPARPLPEPTGADAVDHLAGFPTVVVDVPLLRGVIAASRGHQLSRWDALILRAAATSGCEELLSEDLQATNRWGDAVRNRPTRVRTVLDTDAAPDDAREDFGA